MEKLVGLLDKVPTGVNTFGWLFVLSMLLHFAWKNRREAHNETTHLRTEMEAFTARLSEQNDKLMKQNDQLIERVGKLEEENQELRNEVRGLQDVIDGLRRQNNSEHISTQRALIKSLPLTETPQTMKELLHEIVDDNVSKQKEQDDG